MEFNDLVFEAQTVTSDRRYEVILRVQDDDGGDWLVEPFDYGTDDPDVAEEVYGLIIANSVEAYAKSCKALGYTVDEADKAGIWFQLFLVDHELDGVEQDIEDYWLSYDVI